MRADQFIIQSRAQSAHFSYFCIMENATYHTLSQYASRELKDTYKSEEIRSICRLIFTDVFHYTNIDIHLKKHENLPESFKEKFQAIVIRLKRKEPIQYIIGTTEFAGLTLEVNPATLIPRPETEELVLWVREYARPADRILDIGTGSGCIAITLAHALPEADIRGFDISAEALRTAAANAARNGVNVRFEQVDIFRDAVTTGNPYDIIVSNPPYVRRSERACMQAQVLEFEPASALFVPDEDPLVYYRCIAGIGKQRLRENGLLFFEINEALAEETSFLLKQTGYKDIKVKKDVFGKDRFIKCRK